MIANSFLDSNILLYACSNSPEDRSKRQRAEELILEADFALSTQVLQEFIANALRKKELGLTEENIDAVLELASKVPVQAVDLPLVIKAVTLRRRYQLSHWDATIVGAALALDCTILYTEDLSDGQMIDGLRITNPFT